MATNESTAVWHSVKRRVDKNIVELHRVENMCHTGTPDVWFAHVDGVSGWIELKHSFKFGRKPCTTWLFEEPQQIFMLHCHRKNVPHYLLCVWEDGEGGKDWYLIRTNGFIERWTVIEWEQFNNFNLFHDKQFDVFTAQKALSVNVKEFINDASGTGANTETATDA